MAKDYGKEWDEGIGNSEYNQAKSPVERAKDRADYIEKMEAIDAKYTAQAEQMGPLGKLLKWWMTR